MFMLIHIGFIAINEYSEQQYIGHFGWDLVLVTMQNRFVNSVNAVAYSVEY